VAHQTSCRRCKRQEAAFVAEGKQVQWLVIGDCVFHASRRHHQCQLKTFLIFSSVGGGQTSHVTCWRGNWPTDWDLFLQWHLQSYMYARIYKNKMIAVHTHIIQDHHQYTTNSYSCKKDSWKVLLIYMLSHGPTKVLGCSSTHSPCMMK
jgi:hypothetical protein